MSENKGTTPPLLTKQQRQELVRAAHTLGDFTLDTDHRAEELILLVESYMASCTQFFGDETAAQHLKREQEPAPLLIDLATKWLREQAETQRFTNDFRPSHRDSLVKLLREAATQPPQEPWRMTSDEREMLNIVLSTGEFDTLVKHIEHVVNQKARKL